MANMIKAKLIGGQHFVATDKGFRQVRRGEVIELSEKALALLSNKFQPVDPVAEAEQEKEIIHPSFQGNSEEDSEPSPADTDTNTEVNDSDAPSESDDAPQTTGE